MIVKDVLGPGLGTLFLVDVVFAVFVCALAVHAGTVRLIFAMARDNNLPLRTVARPRRRGGRRPRSLPALLVGVLAAALLVVNINLPHVIETLCSVAIVWVNLAYLLVTVPLLVARLRERRRNPRVALRPGRGGQERLLLDGPARACRSTRSPSSGASSWSSTSAGRAPEIYGPDPWGRFAAPLATLGLLVVGRPCIIAIVQRRRTGDPGGTRGRSSLDGGSSLAARRNRRSIEARGSAASRPMNTGPCPPGRFLVWCTARSDREFGGSSASRVE